MVNKRRKVSNNLRRPSSSTNPHLAARMRARYEGSSSVNGMVMTRSGLTGAGPTPLWRSPSVTTACSTMSGARISQDAVSPVAAPWLNTARKVVVTDSGVTISPGRGSPSWVAPQGVHGGFEIVAGGGQGVEDAALRRRSDPALDDARLFEFFEPGGEHVRGDARQSVQQVGVAARPHCEIANDQHCPPLAHQLQGAGKATVLAEVTTLHSSNIASFYIRLEEHQKKLTCNNEVCWL